MHQGHRVGHVTNVNINHVLTSAVEDPQTALDKGHEPSPQPTFTVRPVRWQQQHGRAGNQLAQRGLGAQGLQALAKGLGSQASSHLRLEQP